MLRSRMASAGTRPRLGRKGPELLSTPRPRSWDSGQIHTQTQEAQHAHPEHVALLRLGERIKAKGLALSRSYQDLRSPFLGR